jgi:hypothetical protein
VSRSASIPLDFPSDSRAAIARFATHPNPALYSARPPATEEALATCETKLRRPLPPELRAALLVHDGIRETYVHCYDYLGGSRTLSKLRRDFREQWTELADELGEDAPFRFGRRYLVLGGSNGTGHDYTLLDTGRLLDGVHPVLRFDFDDGEEVTGFRSLAHYLHWVLLQVNDVDYEKLRKLFPERYSESAFKKMMRKAEKIAKPAPGGET